MAGSTFTHRKSMLSSTKHHGRTGGKVCSLNGIYLMMGLSCRRYQTWVNSGRHFDEEDLMGSS